jgi:hypothetical protein
MRRIAPFVSLAIVTAALAWLPLAASAQSYEDLAGGWIVSSRTSADGEADDSPGRGLYLFTATGQYSMMNVGVDERPDLPEDFSPEELRTAWDSFSANSGRYRIRGDQLTYEAWVAKWPGYMNAWDPSTGGNARTVTMSLDDGLLTLSRSDGWSVTLRRAPGLEGDGGA